MLLGPRLREPRDVDRGDHGPRFRGARRIEPAAEREQCGAKREEVRQRRPEQSRHQRPLVASVAPLAIQSRVCDARYTPAASATVTM